MHDEILKILNKLSNDAIIGIMWDALSDMQSYNGQVMNTVIAMAMGGKVSDVDSSFRLPPVKIAQKKGESGPLF